MNRHERRTDGAGPVPSDCAPLSVEAALETRLQLLGAALDDGPSVEFRAASRARLVAMATVRSPAPARPSLARRLVSRREGAVPARWRARLTAGLAGAALSMTALATLVALSQGASPGDALYNVKRGSEQTELALASDSRRGPTLLDFASTRLDELDDLADSPSALGVGAPAGGVVAADSDDELVLDTLATMDSQTVEGTAWVTRRAVQTVDAGGLATLQDWAAGQRSQLAALTPRLPSGTRERAAESLAILDAVLDRATDLPAALDCAAGPAVQGSDRFGPLPGPCETPVGSTAGSSPPPSDGSSTAATSSAGPDAPAATTTAGADGSEPTGAGSSSGAAGGTTPPAPLPSALPTTVPTAVPPAPVTTTPPQLPLPSLPLPPLLPSASSGGSTTSSPAPLICIDILGNRILC